MKSSVKIIEFIGEDKNITIPVMAEKVGETREKTRVETRVEIRVEMLWRKVDMIGRERSPRNIGHHETKKV